MNYRSVPLVTGEYYHVFNRGVAKQPIFSQKLDYQQFLLTLFYYRFLSVPMRLSRVKLLSVEDRMALYNNLQGEQLVELVAFVLMPNHFHILLQQTSGKGISIFMKKISDSYSKYFNTKYDRVGPIFQGSFKYVHIDDDQQLVHVSRYIHLNPVASYVVKEKDFGHYPWSSLPEYLENKSKLVNKDSVLGHFTSPDAYRNFIFDQIDYAKTLENIKHLTLES